MTRRTVKLYNYMFFLILELCRPICEFVKEFYSTRNKSWTLQEVQDCQYYCKVCFATLSSPGQNVDNFTTDPAKSEVHECDIAIM